MHHVGLRFANKKDEGQWHGSSPTLWGPLHIGSGVSMLTQSSHPLTSGDSHFGIIGRRDALESITSYP